LKALVFFLENLGLLSSGACCRSLRDFGRSDVPFVD